MPYFTDIEPLYQMLDELFKRLSEDPVIKEKALASKLTVCFNYRDPDGQLWIDCTGDDIALKPGQQDLEPDATLTMDTDVAHLFWLGRLNLIKALTSGEIESDGSVPRLLKLLPVIKPAYGIYPELLKAKGLAELVDV